jgi:glycosyltransferase involved in cell wall biosynthesis
VSNSTVMRVITRLNVGGPARHAILLTEALPSRGFSSHLVYGSVSVAEGEFPLAPGTPATRLPKLGREIRPIHDAGALRELGHLIRARRPNIVHTHLGKAGALGRIAARRAHVPVIVHTFHGHVLEGYFSSPLSRGLLALERRLATISDALLAVSNAVREELVALHIGRPDQWRVIPLGLDLEDLLRGQDPGTARQALGLPETGPAVGIVGRLTAIKEHRTFLRAMAHVAHQHPDATFVVAGEGELRARLQTEAARLLGDRCRFLGWVMDLPALYAALDVVVLTSRNEGTPVALIEAGAAGRPVVATKVGGVADVVLDGRTGLLAPASDVSRIANHVLRLLANPAEADALGAAGRGWVRDRFTIDRLADDLAALYQELLDRKGDSARSPR